MSTPIENSANVLIVDDSLISCKKLRSAVRRLGYDADLAEGGAEGLEALAAKDYDVVLLDIVMPGVDGFDVLRAMKDDPQLRDIPVVVVSSLEEERDSVVQAIEMGAEDFLPKDFDPVLLRARLTASLTKKEFRDQEKEYLVRVERLTAAAEIVETGQFKPESLQIDDLREHKDALGQLAAVFTGMAGEIYQRELRLRKMIHALQGIILVITVGISWGSTPAISRLAANAGATPLALATWVNLFLAASYISIAAARGQFKTFKLKYIGFLAIWTVIAAILQRVVLLFLAGQIEATLLALVATFQGFIVFVFASVTRLEKATPQRLIGLTFGLVGVFVVLFDKLDLSGAGSGWWWLVLSLSLPTLYAIEWVFVAAKKPADLDFLPAIGVMMLMSSFILAPSAILVEGSLFFSDTFGRAEWISLILCVVIAFTMITSFKLVDLAGPVFASQSAYAMTMAGIGWGMLLLGETLSSTAWIAVALIVVGLLLVSPKPDNTEIVIKRSFTK
ncbi:response regulator [uncultured Tateyamaria sp.]|uniref:response regulator n=1 Tax=uncultured Tateyamaria sp. TaxID=455651 RepID=UPI002602FF7A|nr:response regulator [uncultured Tateyamaria sp.]